MTGNNRTYRFSVSFSDSAAAGLKAYDQGNTTLFEHNNAYAALNFAMALNGRNLKDCVVGLERVSEKTEDGMKISYEIELSRPLPRNVLQFAQTYLDIERVDL